MSPPCGVVVGDVESILLSINCTGQLLADGFGGEARTEDVIATRPNSRLLVTQEEHMDQNYAVDQVTTRFYVLEKNRFKLLKTITQPTSKTQ